MGGTQENMQTQQRTTRHRIQPHMAQRAANLRRNMTQSERDLWQLLRCKNLGGLKFRRQAVIGPYVVDFLCPQRKLVIEVDGESHVGQGAIDAKRTADLEEQGYRVIRVTNDEVRRDIDAVGMMILHEAGAAPTPQPPPSKGGGMKEVE